MPIGARLSQLAKLITTPRAPHDYIDLVNPLLNPSPLRGRILSTHHESRDTATLQIQIGRGWRGHLAGQYVPIGIDVDGTRHWRTYSIASSPSADRRITITVKAIPHGTVSTHLVRRASVNTLIHLGQAAGNFTVPQPLPTDALFIAAGTGITPIMSILRTHAQAFDDATLIYSASSAPACLFRTELQHLQRTHGLRLIEHHTSEKPRLTATLIEQLVPDWPQRRTWACGPAGLLSHLENHYQQHGLTQNLTVERFYQRTTSPASSTRITFTRSQLSMAPGSDMSVLEAGESAGVLMPWGCRMGVCFSCVLPLRAGSVRDRRDGRITTASSGSGETTIQTCISTAVENCEVDI